MKLLPVINEIAGSVSNFFGLWFKGKVVDMQGINAKVLGKTRN